MKPLATALVDTFNHDKYIEQALVSVVEQGLSQSELEIVVVDDGSTDNTPAIVSKFVPRVKYLRKKNGGQASAFNAAFPYFNGSCLSLLDGDDWWAKGKLAIVLDALERNADVAAVSHAYYQFHEGTLETKLCGPPEPLFLHLGTLDAARLALHSWAFLQPSALTVRRKVLERVIPIPETLVFSADAPFTAVSMALGTLVLPQPLSYYRFHAGNLYAGDTGGRAKILRKSQMDEAMCAILRPALLDLGVSEDCVSELLDPVWIAASRFNLRTGGGSRLKTLETEMRIFHAEFKSPAKGYSLFKHLAVGSATLLLPPRLFYDLRDWYARHNLKRFRNYFFRESGAGSAKLR